MKRKIISFIGLPASGKGTQAKILGDKFGFSVIGMGDLIRETIAENKESKDPFYLDIIKRYEAGVPQPDEIAFDLLKKKIKNIEGGVIFDNFPFNIPQAKMLKEFAKDEGWEDPILFYIEVDPETTVERIAYRKICSSCGAIYNKKDITECDKCGNALISRSDDNEETARKRIEFYIKSINELLGYYKGSDRVITIDGLPSIEDVALDIHNKYEELFK